MIGPRKEAPRPRKKAGKRVARAGSAQVRELVELRERLREAEETIEAIRGGEVDAVVVAGPMGETVYTLKGADHSYRAFMEEMSEGAATLTPAGLCTYCNVRLADMLGQPLTEVVGVPFEAFVADGQRADLAAQLAEAGRGRQKRELTLLRADGSSFPALVSTTASEMDGAPGLCLVVTDLTEQKKAESAVREAHEQLSITMRSIADGVIATDAEGRVVQMNPAAEHLTGWRLQEAAGKPLERVFRIVNEETRRKVESPVTRVLREGHVVGLANHTLLVAKDGVERQVADSGAPIRDAGGKIVGVVLVFRDQSEQRTAEAALEQARRDFREVTEKSPGLVLIHREGTLLWANRAFTGPLGYRPGELAGRRLDSLVHTDGRSHFNELAEQVYRSGGQPERAELRMAGRDEEAITFELTGSAPITFEGARAFVSVGSDVTERRKLEAQLMAADRMASMGTIAAGVAHEINNPLTYAIANLDFMARDLARLREEQAGTSGVPSRRFTEMLEAARDGTERVRVITRDLKTFSRTDEASVGLVDPKRVLDSAAGLASNEIRHRAQLVKSYGSLPAVRCNEGRLGQVVLNLLINAAQAIPEGHSEENEIRLSGRGEGTSVVLEVSDTGPGIPRALLGRIFDPFFTTKPIGTGTGLGLSICHGIVTSMGGQISVTSEEGKGATFRVTLPVAEPETGDRPLPPVLPKPLCRAARILVIDDEPHVCEVFDMALEGHEVVTHVEACSALERLEKGERFDIIFCDVMLPQISGMEFHARVLELDQDQAGRIVFMTGGAFTPRSREFLDAVPNLRMEKPFELATLRAIVSSLLREPAGG